MAIKFQYNKTSLTEMGKQLKVRQRALPTLQNKESALRLEVRKAFRTRRAPSVWKCARLRRTASV